MGEGACQLAILDRPSWGRELTSETIPISKGGQLLQLHSKVLSIYVWESIGEKSRSTFCIAHGGGSVSTSYFRQTLLEMQTNFRNNSHLNR